MHQLIKAWVLALLVVTLAVEANTVRLLHAERARAKAELDKSRMINEGVRSFVRGALRQNKADEEYVKELRGQQKQQQ